MLNTRILARLLLALAWIGLFQAEASAANKFIVNDSAGCTTHNWVAGCFGTSSGSAATPGLPAIGDTVLCDSLSGTTNVTFTVSAAPPSLAAINFTSCSLTNFDNAATPQNFTFTGTSAVFTCVTTSTNIKLGAATWDFTGAASTANTVINITCTAADIQAAGSTIKFSGAVTLGGSRTLTGGGATFNTIWGQHGNLSIAGSNTIGEIKCDASGTIAIVAGTTQTISGGNDRLNFAPTDGSAACSLMSNTGQQATIAQAAGVNTLTWSSVRNIAFTGALASWPWLNSFDSGGNSGTGLTITAPSGGGGGGYVF